MGIGAVGTVRTCKTRRELLEEGFTSGEAELLFAAESTRNSVGDSQVSTPKYSLQNAL